VSQELKIKKKRGRYAGLNSSEKQKAEHKTVKKEKGTNRKKASGGGGTHLALGTKKRRGLLGN